MKRDKVPNHPYVENNECQVFGTKVKNNLNRDNYTFLETKSLGLLPNCINF